MTVRLFPEFDSVSRHSTGRLFQCRIVFALILCFLGLDFFPFPAAQAGEVELEHGTIIRGSLVPILGLTDALASKLEGDVPIQESARTFDGAPIYLVDDGMVRYFVPRRQVVRKNQDQELSRLETFKLPQKVTGRNQMLKTVGSYIDVTDFDKFGRRTVTLNTSKGNLALLQGVTEITPHHLKLTGLKQQWDLGLRTTSIKEDVLDAMLNEAIDHLNPNERIAVARFYIQAGLYLPAGEAFDAIERDFPEYKEKIATYVSELRTLHSQQLLNELNQRRRAGQHRLAQNAIMKFPTNNVAQSILRQIREVQDDYNKQQEQIDKARIRLGELEAEIKDPATRNLLQAYRREVMTQLNFETINRLGAFLNLENDDSLTAQEKLALAYSGWIVGAANVVTDLNTALNLWTARAQVLEYLRTENEQLSDQMLETLSKLEGVSAAVVKQMIPLLPPILDAPVRDITNSFPVHVTDPKAEVPVSYSVLLPIEYDPHHTYPMIVALRPSTLDANSVLDWWGKYKNGPGQSQRRGYIVIAPEYLSKDQVNYEDNVTAHYAVIESIRDARKRFNVDSDRVFLSGHGTGADAAFDIGMSHPDLFAGVMPIAGKTSAFNLHYWQNAKDLPFYIVGGELDRDTLEHNSLVINRMMRYGYDIIYAEYKGRGYESYYEEIHNLFNWMELHQRLKYPKDIEEKILRPIDNRFYWVRTEDLPAKSMQPVTFNSNQRIRARPVELKVNIKIGNVIYVRSGGKINTLWLNPELVDFDKRLEVRIDGQRKFNDFLRPDMKAMLDDFKNRGDRQKLFDARLDFF
ncbi:alpha/beta hydrolase [Gimesia maris]|uniref:Alpha/beta hydrolase family protein n=1 Tax=Gimesia maris TaxID=122 RepID=A0ABX5YGF9_9PLAN|nr:alpha/beta hydrolase [Gimesia maris]EDL61829.1 hypothetical protein PM8797T_05990 [Gimesia maris DSM 8797]QEG14789.1 hypothetical protein GmarT_06260 [Gimesia maris]QGQ31820.1 alpha/beta hydrolase [Gimesia maris]